MKKLLIGLLAITSLSSYAKNPIALIGAEADFSQCELHLRGDFKRDSEGFTINDAAIKNRLTSYEPLAFNAYIGDGGHNWMVSLGHKNLELIFDKNEDIDSYIYKKDGQVVKCNLKDAEIVLLD